MGRPRERVPAPLQNLIQTKVTMRGAQAHSPHWFLPQGRLKDISKPWEIKHSMGDEGEGGKSAIWAAQKDRREREVESLVL